MKKNDFMIDVRTITTNRLKLPTVVEVGVVKFDRENAEILDDGHWDLRVSEHALTELMVFFGKGDKNVWSWGPEHGLPMISDLIGVPVEESRDARSYCLELADQFQIDIPLIHEVEEDPRDEALYFAGFFTTVYQHMRSLS